MVYIKKIILPLLAFIILFSGITLQGCAQEKEKTKVQWLSWNQAIEKCKKEPKKIFVDAYTDWCGWCKKMEANTFNDATISEYVNKNFYPVKLNAETKDSLIFHDKKFGFKPEYKSNELAAILLNGQMSYPTVVFLNEKMEVITPVAGYQAPDQMMPILKYISEDIYLTKSWQDYNK